MKNILFIIIFFTSCVKYHHETIKEKIYIPEHVEKLIYKGAPLNSWCIRPSTFKIITNNRVFFTDSNTFNNLKLNKIYNIDSLIY